MTDGEAVKIARRIDKLNWEITKLCEKIANEHPNGEAMLDEMGGLRDNGFDNPASAEHCIHSFLTNPDKWEIRNYTLVFRQ